MGGGSTFTNIFIGIFTIILQIFYKYFANICTNIFTPSEYFSSETTMEGR